ncbi:MAG: carboxymuconolactone decarboxylase family protein [Deltaproteobacteria bacterium]|nr:carboxymuconolactone decarboxylase family protein [Deltaproteobacteria bacterium]
MSEDYLKALKKKTARTAQTYFEGYTGERPFDLWSSFDKGLGMDLSLFITGQMYARERIPHQTRQMVAVAALTALERTEELRLHLHAALNVGCSPRELAEVIFQVGVYAGMPVVNAGLKTLKSLLEERGEWPLSEED